MKVALALMFQETAFKCRPISTLSRKPPCCASVGLADAFHVMHFTERCDEEKASVCTESTASVYLDRYYGYKVHTSRSRCPS